MMNKKKMQMMSFIKCITHKYQLKAIYMNSVVKSVLITHCFPDHAFYMQILTSDV